MQEDEQSKGVVEYKFKDVASPTDKVVDVNDSHDSAEAEHNTHASEANIQNIDTSENNVSNGIQHANAAIETMCDVDVAIDVKKSCDNVNCEVLYIVENVIDSLISSVIHNRVTSANEKASNGEASNGDVVSTLSSDKQNDDERFTEIIESLVKENAINVSTGNDKDEISDGLSKSQFSTVDIDDVVSKSDECDSPSQRSLVLRGSDFCSLAPNDAIQNMLDSVHDNRDCTNGEIGNNVEKSEMLMHSIDNGEGVSLKHEASVKSSVMPDYTLSEDDDYDLVLTSDAVFDKTTGLPNGLNEEALLKLHPIHQKLQSEMISLQWKCKEQAEQITRLQSENHAMTLELAEKTCPATTSEIYEVQMEALENTITQLQREIESYKTKLSFHDEIAKKTIAQINQELGGKLEKMTKSYELANKDKEMMVIKYAQSQKEVLNMKKLFEEFDKKYKDSLRERDMLQLKLKNLNAERSRISQCLESKNSEQTILQRENEKLKEQASSKDIKIKWAQNKLWTEIDAHKETSQKLEKLQQKLQETREEAEQIRRDCQEIVRTYQESEDIKSNSLDLQLKEKESELKLERQEKTDQEEIYSLIKRELDALKKKHKLTIDENNSLTSKVQTLERERLDYETNLSRLKELVNNLKQELVDLTAKLSEMNNLEMLLDREKEKFLVSQQEIERMRSENIEIQNDMDACRCKEGELLEFTERLTAKNVILQSEFAALEAKNQMMVMDQNRLNKSIHSLEEEKANLASRLEEANQLRQQETQLLARKLAEKTRSTEHLDLKLQEEINENKVMKRRHLASIKELTREIHQLKRRLECFESPLSSSAKLNPNSRTGSSGSLDSNCNSNSLTGMNNPALSQSTSDSTQLSSHLTSGDHNPGILVVDPVQQAIIERIVKLQRALARKNEKIEFLEEHVIQLDLELRKKSRIIQGYVMKLETGALATTKMDQNKMDVARKGGIMASVYSSQVIDGAMTFDLSLEINRKLQAVLEDTLLKNITLKENINTLGEEIARLTQDKHRLQDRVIQTAEAV